MPTAVAESFPRLKNVDLYVTTACDRSCSHCMAYDVWQEQGTKHMEKELFFRIIDDLRGIEKVHIAGTREPFMHPDILEMLSYAGERVKEVRVNTNGSYLENITRDDYQRLPKNLHIYLSVDEQHGEGIDLHGRIDNLLCYCLDGRKLTFNVRGLDKYKVTEKYLGEHLDFIQWAKKEYGDDAVSVIENRILRMGRAKEMEGAVYVNLSKLLENHRTKPMIGILHDGTVVTNFIVAYLPESNRPRVCVLGNVTERHLAEMLGEYEEKRLFQDKDFMLSSMIADMGSYPFVIKGLESNKFNWNGVKLMPYRNRIIHDMIEKINQGLEKGLTPSVMYGWDDKLLSKDGNLGYDVRFDRIVSEKEARKFLERFERLAKENDLETPMDGLLKLYLLCRHIEYQGWQYFKGDELAKRAFPTHLIVNASSPDLWNAIFKRAGISEKDLPMFMGVLSLDDDLTGYFGLDFSKVNEFLSRVYESERDEANAPEVRSSAWSRTLWQRRKFRIQ